MQAKTWTMEIFIDEHENQTRARAQLHTTGELKLVGSGLARLNPHDANVPEIGDELAVARALADLSHQLINITADDIEAITHQPTHLYQ